MRVRTRQLTDSTCSSVPHKNAVHVRHVGTRLYPDIRVRCKRIDFYKTLKKKQKTKK